MVREEFGDVEDYSWKIIIGFTIGGYWRGFGGEGRGRFGRSVREFGFYF